MKDHESHRRPRIGWFQVSKTCGKIIRTCFVFILFYAVLLIPALFIMIFYKSVEINKTGERLLLRETTLIRKDTNLHWENDNQGSPLKVKYFYKSFGVDMMRERLLLRQTSQKRKDVTTHLENTNHEPFFKVTRKELALPKSNPRLELEITDKESHTNNISDEYLHQDGGGRYKDYTLLSDAERKPILDSMEEWFTIKNESRDSLLNNHQYVLHHNPSCDSNTDLLVLVHSAVRNFEQRMKIRHSWGSVKFHKNVSISVFFILAEANDSNDTEVNKEANKYGDIVQGNFIDSYRNLTYKHILTLHWALLQCHDVRSIVRCDDDVMINIFRLALFSSTIGPYHNTLYCSPMYNGFTIRHPNKWYTPYELYPFRIFPVYCEGFAYVTSLDEIRLLYKASENMKFFWIEDVYVTGILARKAGLQFKYFAPEHSCARSEDDAAGLDVTFYLNHEDWPRQWSRILSIKDTS